MGWRWRAEDRTAERRGRRRGTIRAVPDDGERLLLPCDGGPSQSRLVRYPPPLEIPVAGGMYVLVDDGPTEVWRYEFVVVDPG